MKSETIWFAVDEDGDEVWFLDKPMKIPNTSIPGYWMQTSNAWGVLWPGAIQAITGKKLSWEDEPLEWKPQR